MNKSYRILSELLAGLLLCGGIGWILDHFLRTSFCLPAGLVLGLALAVYALYLRGKKGERRLFADAEGAQRRTEKGETR